MNIHERTQSTPLQRKEVYLRHHREHVRVTLLAEEYHVSPPTIYKILARGRKRDFSVHNGCNARFRCLQWAVKRLAKIEKKIEDRLKKEAKRCNKKYPGERVHMDYKRLPLLEGQSKTGPRESMFVAIDDFGRELYVAVMPDKTTGSAARFLNRCCGRMRLHDRDSLYGQRQRISREFGASLFCGAVSEKRHRAEIHVPGDPEDQWQGGTSHTNLDGDVAR